MSKTYRRKNESSWYKDEDEFNAWDEGWYCKRFKHKYNVFLAWFHSDRYDPSTPSRVFRREYGHKRDRSNTKVKLNRELYALDKGNEMFNKARDIAWDWD